MKIFRHKQKIRTFLLRFVQTNTCSSFQETRVKRQSGFTLVELLIVIALMAVLWGVAYTMFYQSKRVFSLSDNKLGTYQYARIAMDEISRDLKGATLKDNVDYFRSFTTGHADAKSNNSVLTFLSLTPNGSSTPVTLITYYLKNTDELMRAEYNDTSYIYGTVPTSIDPSQFTSYKLTANTTYFNLAYVTGSASVSAWDSTSG
ncbi:MAG: prepilin-type N-terminal cleavage/methylation domain-containing protein, partial [Planctomycetes bacterium]|nr:prepilin-type N-terminal cleavage/methylation domain-containing protein [Planctomycetota bacterium]